MEYSRLVESGSLPSLNSVITGDQIDHSNGTRDYLCQLCKHKLMKKQQTTHQPIDCLNQRCQLLENEVFKLRDHDMKSRLQIKELHNQIQTLENVLKGLTSPKQEQATPYSLGKGFKLRQQLQKSNSADLPSIKAEINYDHILKPKRSNSRDRVGLFGSLGASSQHR